MDSIIHDQFYKWKIAVLVIIGVLSVQSQMIMSFSGEKINEAVLRKQETDNQENGTAVFIERQLLPKRREKRQSQSKQRPFNLCASKSHCSGSETVFNTGLLPDDMRCYCDNACYQRFYDCCPDYESTCGTQRMTSDDTDEMLSWWKCVAVKGLLAVYDDAGGVCKYLIHVWMVQRCPRTWSSDSETKRKCHDPNSQSYPFPIEEHLPVVAENNFTYRNKYCAICHGVKNYSTWDIRVETLVTPPAEYIDLNAKLRFIRDNNGKIVYFPAENQPKRYCIGEKTAEYRDSCDNVSHSSSKDCVKGPVEIVGPYFGHYFKNKACAACNGMPQVDSWVFHGNTVCASNFGGSGFSIIFKFRSTGTAPPRSKIVKIYCPRDTVYDERLEFCRKAYVISAKNVLSNEFLVLLWLRSTLNPMTFHIFGDRFKKALMDKFNLMSSQISAMNFYNQGIKYNSLAVVTFRLTLTHYQDFILANQENLANMNITSRAKTFLELLKFTGNLSIYDPYPVIKVVSKQLACFQGRQLKPSEYQLNKTTQVVFENKTGKYFSPKDYPILKGESGNITICRKFVLAQCVEGSAYVTLRRGEYVILSNLSLYHKNTNRTFDFGEYQINDDIDNVNESFLNSSDPERSKERFAKNITFPTHVTFAVCLPGKGSYNITITTKEGTRSDSDALAILTLVGFSISILWLLFFLITYGIFTELRTVPGVNLMNLCFSLLLFNFFWLIGTPSHSKLITFCTGFAILEHYLILVSFVAMSVLSYHSCQVFSQSFAIAKTTKDKRRRSIMKYSAIVWCCPAIFVAICVALDKTGVFAINYGTDCWLGTKNAKLYLFLLPIASLLLYNISAFIKTAVSLTRHQNQTQLLQKKKRQNLLICAKLSTMVGFPWIFAFFGVIFPDVVAFEYLFVIFVCLQGFYIGVAFSCNSKTFKLYKNLRNKNEADVEVPLAGRRHREIQTTRL